MRARHKYSLQLRVFRLGLLQDGNVGVGVFPQSEEVLVGTATFAQITVDRISTGESQMCEGILRGYGRIVSVINDVPKLACRVSSLLCTQVCLSSDVDWQKTEIRAQFIPFSDLQF